MLRPGIEVRHLNCDRSDFSSDNIEIGTRSENFHDTPEHVHRERLVKAARALRKYGDAEFAAAKAMRASGATYREIGAHFGGNKNTGKHLATYEPKIDFHASLAE